MLSRAAAGPRHAAPLVAGMPVPLVLALPLALAALLVVMPDAAHAQSPLGIGSAEPSFAIGGPFGPFLAFINHYQQSFYRSLTKALIAMQDDPGALGWLIGLSFAYGVFHAAGPGHGKAVISSYMIANEVELKRGVAISFVSSLIQGLVAVLVVGAAFLVLRRIGIQLTVATQAMEIASFGLVVLFGVWLLWKKIRALVRSRAPSSAAPAAAASAPVTALAFAAAGAKTASEPLQRQAQPRSAIRLGDRRNGRQTTALNFQAVEVEAHDYQGQGEYCETCGVSHMPDPALLRSDTFDLREAWSAIIAVGLRPCSGAILVMSFSLLNGLYLGGILSVAAMSIGTAITVTILATIAVTAKDLALRIAGPRSRSGRLVGHAIEIGGALFVTVVGLALLGASLQYGGFSSLGG